MVGGHGSHAPALACAAWCPWSELAKRRTQRGGSELGSCCPRVARTAAASRRASACRRNSSRRSWAMSARRSRWVMTSPKGRVSDHVSMCRWSIGLLHRSRRLRLALLRFLEVALAAWTRKAPTEEGRFTRHLYRDHGNSSSMSGNTADRGLNWRTVTPCSAGCASPSTPTSDQGRQAHPVRTPRPRRGGSTRQRCGRPCARRVGRPGTRRSVPPPDGERPRERPLGLFLSSGTGSRVLVEEWSRVRCAVRAAA